jgi:hypothetical protein
MQLAFRRDSNPLFAKRTKAKIKKDTRSKPFDFESLFYTFHMEDMATTATNAR